MFKRKYEQILNDLAEIIKAKDKLIESQEEQIKRLQKMLDEIEEIERNQIETRGRYEL